MPDLKLLVLQMAVILVAARLTAAAFRFVGQPGVVGEMAAGILLGPSLLGRISPAAMNGLFPATGLGPLYALSQLGLVLFMFIVGLELRPGVIRGSRKIGDRRKPGQHHGPLSVRRRSGVGPLSELGKRARKLPFVLFLGAAIGVTAFPVLARILADRKLMHTRAGAFAIACAAVDDLVAWCLLAAITAVTNVDVRPRPTTTRRSSVSPRLAFIFSRWCF